MDINGNDMKMICASESVDWKVLKDSTILVTGATGLIGTILANSLAYSNREKHLNLRIIGLVRNADKARKRLDKDIVIKTAPIEESVDLEEPIDFIIHAATPTASAYFVSNPVETIKVSISGTSNMLDLAKSKAAKGFVFLSSMEVYGHPSKDHFVSETEIAGFDSMITRNCYPMSKQICESLCKAYQSEYGIPTKIVRLTQTFGPGVEYNDGRVFAEFMRSVIEKRDIVLHTAGKTERCYLYTADAVTAILTVLTRGKEGEAYTAANPDTYCSILEMAELVANTVANGSIGVRVEIDNTNRGYATELHMRLDTRKIEGLGWKAKVNLTDAFSRMIETAVTMK